MKLMMNKKAKGQGVVEYAGALVIGAVIVATALAAGPTAINGVFTTLTGNITTMFTTPLSNIQ
jgi:Flp pilus assembly pilin Flp